MRTRQHGRSRHRDPRGPGAACGGLAAAWGGLCVAAAGAGPVGSGPERRAGRRVVGTGAALSSLRQGGRDRSSSSGAGGVCVSPRGAPAQAENTLGPVGSAAPARVCAGCARRKFGRSWAVAVPRRCGCKQVERGGRRWLGPGEWRRGARRWSGPPGRRRLAGPRRSCLLPGREQPSCFTLAALGLWPLAGVSGPKCRSLFCGQQQSVSHQRDFTG